MWTKTELILIRVFIFLLIIAPLVVAGEGREVVAHEPLITWNLYTTPIVVAVSTGIIMLYITRLFKRRDTQEEEIDKLKQINLDQWRKAYTETQCGIKSTVDRIEKNMDLKVDKVDCKDKEKDVWAAIDKLRDNNK